MELLYASCVGVLVTCGVFLLLRARTFPVVLGLTMISYAVNLFLFSSGRLTINKAVVLGTGAGKLCFTNKRNIKVIKPGS